MTTVLLLLESNTNRANNPSGGIDRQHTQENNNRLAEGRCQCAVVGNDDMAIAELVYQVLGLNSHRSSAKSIEIRLVDADGGFRDGGFGNVDREFDISMICISMLFKRR